MPKGLSKTIDGSVWENVDVCTYRRSPQENKKCALVLVYSYAEHYNSSNCVGITCTVNNYEFLMIIGKKREDSQFFIVVQRRFFTRQIFEPSTCIILPSKRQLAYQYRMHGIEGM